jgi:hypothetical protein
VPGYEYWVCRQETPGAPGDCAPDLGYAGISFSAASAVLQNELQKPGGPGAALRVLARQMTPNAPVTEVCRYTSDGSSWHLDYCTPGLGAEEAPPGRPTGFPPEPGPRPVPQTDVNLQGASTWWSTRSDGERIAVAVGGTLLGVVLLRAIL